MPHFSTKVPQLVHFSSGKRVERMGIISWSTEKKTNHTGNPGAEIIKRQTWLFGRKVKVPCARA